MKYCLSLILYHLGDIISRTTMQWFNGFGYFIYQKVMNWSVNLDNEHKIWKPVKHQRRKRK